MATSGEFLSDESPSRMRTRNKQAKDQPNSKRPKRGSETTDVPNESPKTPSKSDKKKTTKETPTKGKKRTNIDLDMENDGSDEKEKRKRTDVCIIKIPNNSFYFLIQFLVNFQSPTESMNSDSRPDSVDDEQENTCDPPETPLAETEPKEPEDKLVDPLQISNPLSVISNAEKSGDPQEEDTAQEATAAKATSSNENSDADATASESTDAAKVAPSNEQIDEKSNITTLPISTAASATTPTISVVSETVVQDTDTPKDDVPAISTPAYVPKEQEMLSTIANIKQETNPPPASIDYPPKDVQIFIKKEPTEEAADNSNSNSNEPQDLKLAADIKSESKCGLDLSDHENKFSESAPVPNQHIKFGGSLNLSAPPQSDSQVKYPLPEPVKYSEPLKYPPHDMHSGPKYSQAGADPNKFHPDGASKYDIKGFLEHKYPEGGIKPYPEAPPNENPPPSKTYHSEPTDLKYSGENQTKYTPPISEPLKYESIENSIIKRLPYPDPHHPIRSLYDPAQMIKYGDPMQKYPGLPPPMGLPDMKYLPPADLKYRPPDNLVKPPFSADNLIKSNSYGEYPGALKYPPTESPIDASARSTPNQDSQSSNSNMPPQLQHNSSTSSPHTNSPHLNHSVHMPPTSGPPMLLGPGGGGPGMPPYGDPSGGEQSLGNFAELSKRQNDGIRSLSHLPISHPSMVPSHSSPSVTPVSTQPSHHHHHMPPSTVSSPMHQPLGLIGPGSGSSSIPQQGPPLAHPGLHRPHQDMPPLMHHPGGPFTTGLPPPHSSAHPQIASPALSVSRSEPDRNDLRRLESLHHGSSPGMPPAPGPPLLSHPSLALHLPGNLPPSAIPLLQPHHPGHLGPPLLPPSSAPLSLIGGPPISSASSAQDGRRTPTSMPASSSHPSTPITSSAFSRTSPSVQFCNLPPSAAHRSASPNQPPPSSIRASPLHLSHHSSASALSAAAAAAAERDRQAIMRQQSPHMTPPPVSSSSLVASPLNKLYGSQTPQPRNSPPPHHLRPGASPPVMRHPQMPLPLPLIGPAPGMPPQMGMHHPYSPHHLMHPMFYSPHGHNPFNSPYPYHAYGPPGFQYMKPPGNPGIDPAVLQHHQSATARLEESVAHAEKQLGAANSSNSQHKVCLIVYLACIA